MLSGFGTHAKGATMLPPRTCETFCVSPGPRKVYSGARRCYGWAFASAAYMRGGVGEYAPRLCLTNPCSHRIPRREVVCRSSRRRQGGLPNWPESGLLIRPGFIFGGGFSSDVFPLTPALSLREREPRSPPLARLKRLRLADQPANVLPLPWGEGRGEG
jgi:hypothetical protein